MAWEWVAPTATGVGAVISTVAVYLTAREGRHHAERVARESASAAERLAHQQRVADQRAAAYLEVLTLANHLALWAERISPALEIGDPSPDPPLPTDDEQVRVRALLGTYASAEVARDYEHVMTTVKRVAAAVRHLRLLQHEAKHAPRGTVDTMTAWGELEDTARPVHRHAHDALTARISAELRTVPPDPDRTTTSSTATPGALPSSTGTPSIAGAAAGATREPGGSDQPVTSE